MPKEYVESSFGPRVSDDGKGSASVEPPFRATVGWSRDTGHVQIATVDPQKEARFDGSAGYYVDLDRDGINRLIRTLRRARDQAFGKDE